MREIKFRIRMKDRNTKQITVMEVALVGTNSLTDLPFNIECFEILSADQFTGLYDKSGKEIFEGDLVKYPNIKCRETQRDETHIIAWGQNGYVADLPGHPILTAWLDDTCEIVGNIYDNLVFLEKSP